jgi:hypothetical protein
MADLGWLEDLKPGDVVRVERRFGWQGLDSKPDTAKEVTVVRRTPRRAYFGVDRWICTISGRVLPRYLDYRTDAVALVSSAPKSDEK